MSLLRILEAHPDLSGFHDREVSHAIDTTDGLPSPSSVDLAGASLGNSFEAIERLVEADALPSLLDEGGRAELRRVLGVERLDQDTIRRSREEVARWLGLPGGVSVTETELPNEVKANYALFRHQRTALREVEALLGEGRHRVLIHMPTGSGKTRTTMNLVAQRLRKRERTVVVWLASTTELCEQSVEEFAETWGYLGDRSVSVICAWGGREWDIDDCDDGFLVATPQTLRSRKRSDGSRFISRLGRRTSLIVFDEAHQAIAPTFRDITEHLARSGSGGGSTPVIGLTATPGRTFGKGDEDAELAGFFNENKVTLSVESGWDSGNPVEFLIEEDYLADPEFRLLLPEDSKEMEVERSQPSNINYSLNDSVELEMDPVDYLGLVGKATLDLIDEGHRRVLVFAASVRLAHKLAALLRAVGIRAESVDGGTPDRLRAGAIARYRSDDSAARVLVNYGVLTTGFDAPATSAAVVARPTKSVVLYNQMIGRAIRGPKAGGNRVAEIVTVVDPGVSAFGSIAEAFSHWEDLWNE